MTPLNYYPAWICPDCGQKYGLVFQGIVTFHEGVCGWCGRTLLVTEPRHYGHPPYGRGDALRALRAMGQEFDREGVEE